MIAVRGNEQDSSEKIRTNIGLSIGLWEKLKIRAVREKKSLSKVIEDLLNIAIGQGNDEKK